MDSWSCGSEGRGPMLSDETVRSSNDDALARNRKMCENWDFKTSSNYENGMLASGSMGVGSQGLMGSSGNGRAVSSSCGLVNPIIHFGEEESVVSGVSSSNVESNSRDSSLIDLKLGRLADCREALSGKSKKEVRVASSIVSPAMILPVKRSRPGNLNGQAPCCQVHGCNMDLSSSKDYHKRHKVCEIHSKTARVIVNGTEQRFCQQCSRFHLLAEFDDGKRSCRKRLAGHNERRRKPQLDNHSGRIAKILPSFHGGSFLGTSLAAGASFACPNIFPNGTAHGVKFDSSNWLRNVKIEDDANPQPLISVMNNHLLPKPFHNACGMEKQFPSLHDTASGNMCCANGSKYVQDFSGSLSIFQNASPGIEGFASFNTLSTNEGVPGVSNSGCALSLLSIQSHNSSTYLSAIPMSSPLTIHGRQTCHNVGQFPDKLLAVSSRPFTSKALNWFPSTGIEDDHMGTVLVPDDSNAVDFEAQAESHFQAPDFVNTKDFVLSHEHGHTIDLLPLSSQLQSEELRRH